MRTWSAIKIPPRVDRGSSGGGRNSRRDHVHVTILTPCFRRAVHRIGRGERSRRTRRTRSGEDRRVQGHRSELRRFGRVYASPCFSFLLFLLYGPECKTERRRGRVRVVAVQLLYAPSVHAQIGFLINSTLGNILWDVRDGHVGWNSRKCGGKSPFGRSGSPESFHPTPHSWFDNGVAGELGRLRGTVEELVTRGDWRGSTDGRVRGCGKRWNTEHEIGFFVACGACLWEK